MSRRPDVAEAPAEEPTGYAVTVWVEGVASQEDADEAVARLLAGGTVEGGVTAAVVPE